MKHLNQFLIESVDKKILGQIIGISDKLKPLFSELNIDDRRMDDKFCFMSRGEVDYINRKLFNDELSVKVYSGYLTELLKKGREKFSVEQGVMELGGYYKNFPTNYFRAIINAITSEDYEETEDGIFITKLDYTKEDYTEDMKK